MRRRLFTLAKVLFARGPAFRLAAFTLLLGFVLVPALTAATEVRSFRMQTRESFLAGNLDGIGVGPLGILRLAERVERLTEIGEPFVFAATRHPDGWVLGTGNAGKVLLLDRSGKLTTLFAAPEPEIFAVWVDDDGTVFAGSSPGGKVYRIAGGEANTFFEPEQTYIWGLARAADGDLLVATGTDGKLFKVGLGGEGEVFFDSEDTHLRTLKVLPSGDVLIGTAGAGLILKVDPRGGAHTIFDAPHPEVVALATGVEGISYAATLASEASLVDLAAPASPQERSGQEGQEETGQAPPAISVTVAGAGGQQHGVVGTRQQGFKGPRSEILRISPSGLVETVARFEEETVYSLLWHDRRLWIATGLEGKVFSLQDGKPVLEKDVDERQVVMLVADQPAPAFATTNAAAFYRISGEMEQRGVYTSPALDAGQIARFGTLRWRGELPEGTRLLFSVRSGLSAEPDQTWSSWSPSADGREVALTGVSSGRFLQWRGEFRSADGRSPQLSEVVVSYQQANLPPRIKSLSVLDPGQILVPTNFNPANQVFEPAHPNREGIFTILESAKPAEDARHKTLWKHGYRTLSWEAEDPNDDELVYELAFRPDDLNQEWLTIVEDLDEERYSFDATALPDGLYRFRLTVSDRPRLQADEALRDEELSELVLIDHTPPVLERISRQGDGWEVTVEDALNPLREAVFSVDAGEWRPAPAEDGLIDGQREDLKLNPDEEGRFLLLRVTDAAFNVVTFNVLKEAR